MADTLRWELLHDRQWLHCTLNAPKGNVLDGAMLAGIDAALDACAGERALKLLVFEGSGAHFSFGASVAEHRPAEAAGMLARFHGLLRRIAALGIPSAAVVRGQCLGGGLELAALTTWIFASPDARFGQPEIKLAVFPPAASVLLPWRLGGARALDLCVSGRTIDAAEAARIGLVHAVAAEPQRAAEQHFREHLAPLSASSLRFAERAARLGLVHALERDLPLLERLYLDELMPTADAVEGIEAFLAKRAPRWEAAR